MRRYTNLRLPLTYAQKLLAVVPHKGSPVCWAHQSMVAVFVEKPGLERNFLLDFRQVETINALRS